MNHSWRRISFCLRSGLCKRSWESEEFWNVPLSPWTSRGFFSHDSGLPHYTRNSMGTSGNVFAIARVPESNFPSLPVIAMMHGKGLKREPQSSTIQTPRLSRILGIWNSKLRTGGTYSQKLCGRSPEVCYLGNAFREIPRPRWTFSVGRVSTPFPQLTLSWIHEVAKSVDDLMTSQSIGGRDFHDFEMFDARIASALRKILISTSFKKRVSIEKRAQRQNRFFRGRQIAYMIYDHIQATGAHDAAHNAYQICSTSACRMTTFKMSIQDGTKFYLTRLSWKFCAKWSCRVLINFRQYQLCTTKNWIEIKSRLGLATSEPEMKDLRREHWSRVEKEETSATKEELENVSSGKQLDSVRKGTLVVLTTSPILVKEHSHPLPLRRRRLRLTEESLTCFALHEERVFQDQTGTKPCEDFLK